MQLATDGEFRRTLWHIDFIYQLGGVSRADEQVWTNLTAAYAEEVRRLSKLGCRYLQVDDTSLAYLNYPVQRAMIFSRGEHAEYQHPRYIR